MANADARGDLAIVNYLGDAVTVRTGASITGSAAPVA
jgi:hypothetical protein